MSFKGVENSIVGMIDDYALVPINKVKEYTIMLNNKTEIFEILQKIPNYEQTYTDLLSRRELEYIPLDIALDFILEKSCGVPVCEQEWSNEEIHNDTFSIKDFINILTEFENKGYTSLYFDADGDEVFISVSKQTLKSEEAIASEVLLI